MKAKDILEVVNEMTLKWTNEQIGKFVRRALRNDITQEDLIKEVSEEY